MKLTKREFNRIIKEELKAVLREGHDGWYSDEHETVADRKWADNPDNPIGLQPRPQGHVDLENIMIDIKDAYGAQSSDEEKEQFETFLLKNVMQYMEAWREERAQKNLGDLK
jgi:hypothetical protein